MLLDNRWRCEYQVYVRNKNFLKLIFYALFEFICHSIRLMFYKFQFLFKVPNSYREV